jgi:hypothetical protein
MISIFKERKLKIKISTNLDMKTQSQENFIDFNISILKIPKSNINSLLKLEDYPYFTGEVKYPWNYLYNIPYQRKLEFFFNHNNFIQILLQYNANFAYSDVSPISNNLTTDNFPYIFNVSIAMKIPYQPVRSVKQ